LKNKLARPSLADDDDPKPPTKAPTKPAAEKPTPTPAPPPAAKPAPAVAPTKPKDDGDDESPRGRGNKIPATAYELVPDSYQWILRRHTAKGSKDKYYPNIQQAQAALVDVALREVAETHPDLLKAQTACGLLVSLALQQKKLTG
jgi:hypothetical protein